MFLLGDGNKGFWLYRDWEPILERLKGEVYRLKSKLNLTITKISKINDLKLLTRINDVIKISSTLEIIYIKLKSKMKEIYRLDSKIIQEISLKGFIASSKIKKSIINITKNINNKIVEVFNIFTKIKKDE